MQYLVPYLNKFEWQKAVKNFLAEPPPPIKGDRYIIATEPTGEWIGYENYIVYYDGNSWIYVTPERGYLVWVDNEATYYYFGGINWVKLLHDTATIQIRRTTNYSLSTLFSNISFDTIDVATNLAVLEHDSTDTSRIIIKEAGTYLISYNIRCQPATSATTRISSRILRNGNTIISGSSTFCDIYQNKVHALNPTCIATFNKDDYIVLQAMKSITDAASLIADSVLVVTKLGGMKGEKGDPTTGRTITTTINLNPNRTNYATIQHNLKEQFVPITLLYKNSTNQWINASNILEVEFYDSNTIRLYNISASTILAGDAKVVVGSGQYSADGHYYFQAYSTTGGLDINTNSPTAIPFNSEMIKDAVFEHSNYINPSRVLVLMTGLYKISYNISYAGSGRRNVRCYARKNGSIDIIPSASSSYVNSSTDSDGTNAASFMIQLNTNDYVEIVGIRSGTSGSAVTIANQCWIMLEFIRE